MAGMPYMQLTRTIGSTAVIDPIVQQKVEDTGTVRTPTPLPPLQCVPVS